MARNQTFGSHAFFWSEFDALTPRLRRLVANAPYDFSVTKLYQMWLDTQNEAACADYFIRRVFALRDERLQVDWPPGHPMIGSRPKGWS